MFFDNLQVVHNHGPLLQEDAFYPFGVSMAGISSKAAGGIDNKYKFNSSSELNNDLEVGIYETPLRGYDAQIGRFEQGSDPLAAVYNSFSNYAFVGNNPVLYSDPTGAERMGKSGGRSSIYHLQKYSDEEVMGEEAPVSKFQKDAMLGSGGSGGGGASMDGMYQGDGTYKLPTGEIVGFEYALSYVNNKYGESNKIEINDKPISKTIRNLLDYIYDKEGRDFEDEDSHPPTDQPTKFGIDFALFKDEAKKILGLEPTLENLENLTQDQADKVYLNYYLYPFKLDRLTNLDILKAIFTQMPLGQNRVIQSVKEAMNQSDNCSFTINSSKLNTDQIDELNTMKSILFIDKFLDIQYDKYRISAEKTKNGWMWYKGWINRLRELCPN